jgi:hypothetical protein
MIVEPTLAHVAAPVASLKPETRSVSSPARYITLPVAQFEPIEGSPASLPSDGGATNDAKLGATRGVRFSNHVDSRVDTNVET